MSYNGYHQINEAPRLGTVHNNNPLNPFSSNTTNPKQWGTTPDALKSSQDFIEMAAFSLFFAGLWWTILGVLSLVKNWMRTWLTLFTLFLLVASLLAAAGTSYKRCQIWYEYGALEYWQPVKDLLRAGIKRKGIRSLSAGVFLFLAVVVYGPFFVGAVAWVDELGQREHRD